MMADYAALPLRGVPPEGLLLPPGRMPIVCDRRLLKRWRYIGLWGEDCMLCAARVQVGPGRQRFWALWDGSTLRGKTSMVPIDVAVDGVAHAALFDLRWEEDGEPMEVTSRHGDSYIWTRKVPLRATGTVDGRQVELRGLIDDSAGYHERHTNWRWSAGVGETPDGRAVAFNFVEGLHDAPVASERAVWVDGVLSEPPPGAIAEDLTHIDGPNGERLDVAAQAVRAHKENLGLIASDYEQPFATFTGTLPGGVEVARGWGVMERHSAKW